MESLKEVFKIGRGPSSSHTMGPERASIKFKDKYPDADKYIVELYGSLAATGRGHMTDKIIYETLYPKEVEILWDASFVHPHHTNYMVFNAIKNNENIGRMEVFSIGGGTIQEVIDGKIEEVNNRSKYELTTIKHILKWCEDNNKELWEYVKENEDEDIFDYLYDIYLSMKKTIEIGITKDGFLPAKIKFQRKAKIMYEKAQEEIPSRKLNKKMFAYALATSEENASGGTVVTAPTCGACGVLPAVLVSMVEEYNLSKEQIVRGLAIAGIIGSLIKHNATVSGAEGGCQAEIGSATSMASAMATYFMGGDVRDIEYAAESGLEHALGLTCDPIGGYVIIPCIERNAIYALKAYNTAEYVLSIGSEHSIGFDDVVRTMAQTGRDLLEKYKETSTGGLALYYEKLLKKQKGEK